ncbi:coenzyme F420-reducing hydrogenase delta subunit [Methanococcus vannielii SB]|jgi:coenzyme F420 hydrogenase subunit delta|uniref:Coenzyme F420-reducing hydrogenase delta subunit n=1 Tax=Methanococcus vannielii (strain ATCC 35089 / DSM 1224 / JCM 13029 / OCM 148 / SB) TaxID=406327 RepID=A6UPY2_METVS|nr:coenzyme F420-reducing hydrogenase, FrhD protein [Methanococcus vannielii]ABR54554.1 coenzyme F420-reducing hydrogenase delta subunit [Methanococcus vannielii SB]
MMPDSLKYEILVFGCGNVIFADDGFGYEVISRLEKMELPKNVGLIDAGTGAPFYLMSLMDESCITKKIIIVDIIDFKLPPGTLKILSINDLSKIKKYTFDAHDMPLSNYLIKAKNAGMDVVIVGCQAKRVTTPDIEVGLTKEVKDSLDDAVKLVLQELSR